MLADLKPGSQASQTPRMRPQVAVSCACLPVPPYGLKTAAARVSPATQQVSKNGVALCCNLACLVQAGGQLILVKRLTAGGSDCVGGLHLRPFPPAHACRSQGVSDTPGVSRERAAS